VKLKRSLASRVGIRPLYQCRQKMLVLVVAAERYSSEYLSSKRSSMEQRCGIPTARAANVTSRCLERSEASAEIDPGREMDSKVDI
jgi:hypothetical protein